VDQTKPRIDAHETAPEAYEALLTLERYLHQCGLESSLIELVKLRASQINGCAYCIDMHTKDARAAGETEQRLFLLDPWRESPFYSPRERAALAWTEAVTRISETHVPDETYREARQHYSEKELVDLNWVVVAINAWNRLAIPFRSPAGTYQPAPDRKRGPRSPGKK
jgi:AhpD family alkylhydroperoxidase